MGSLMVFLQQTVFPYRNPKIYNKTKDIITFSKHFILCDL